MLKHPKQNASKPAKAMKKLWWRAPLVQAVWGEEIAHRHETWFELFYDLVIVACALQLGHIVPQNMTFYGICYCFSLFLAIQSTWQGFVGYCNRFHTDDLTHMLFYGCQTLGVFMMACHLKSGHGSKYHLLEWPEGFILVFVATRLGFALMYLQVALITSSYYFLYVLSNLLVAGLWLLSLLWTESESVSVMVVWGVAFLVYFAVQYAPSFVMRERYARPVHPLHLPHFVARMGILVMILLGESIIQLISTVRPRGSGGWYYSTVSMGFLLVFLMALQYFDSQPHAVRDHAMRADGRRGAIWIFLHPFMAFSALLVGSAIRLLFMDLNSIEPTHERLLCGATGAYLMSCFAIRMSHKGVSHDRAIRCGRLSAYLLRVTVAILCCLVPSVHKPKPVHTVALLLALLGVLTVLDVFVSKTEKTDHHHGVDYHGGIEARAEGEADSH